MELIEYLTGHFFTRQQLLARCQIDDEQLSRWQIDGVMPKASYHLRVQLECTSCFGPHREAKAVEYYAKGYAHWITMLLPGTEAPQAAFTFQYRRRLSQLALAGIAPCHSSLDSDEHIRSEWHHFLEGTYGLCTASGLPDDIAAKEVAVAIIREITEDRQTPLDAMQRMRLHKAVDLLDSASSPFAPHEVARSSRRRYVDDVRSKYKL